MSVTPVSFSSLRIAHWMGAAPRYFGSNDVCTFKQPDFGRSGCVTTASTLKFGSFNNARRPGHANSAEPMNTTRWGERTREPSVTASPLRRAFAAAPLLDVHSNRSDAPAL